MPKPSLPLRYLEKYVSREQRATVHAKLAGSGYGTSSRLKVWQMRVVEAGWRQRGRWKAKDSGNEEVTDLVSTFQRGVEVLWAGGTGLLELQEYITWQSDFCSVVSSRASTQWATERAADGGAEVCNTSTLQWVDCGRWVRPRPLFVVYRVRCKWSITHHRHLYCFDMFMCAFPLFSALPYIFINTSGVDGLFFCTVREKVFSKISVYMWT